MWSLISIYILHFSSAAKKLDLLAAASAATMATITTSSTSSDNNAHQQQNQHHHYQNCLGVWRPGAGYKTLPSLDVFIPVIITAQRHQVLENHL